MKVAAAQVGSVSSIHQPHFSVSNVSVVKQLRKKQDLDEIQRGKFDLDVAGHYNRPDIFSLSVRQNP